MQHTIETVVGRFKKYLLSTLRSRGGSLETVNYGFGSNLNAHTLEVKRNVCIALAVAIERVAPVVATILPSRVRNLKRKHVQIFSGRLPDHANAIIVGDCLGALKPRNVGHRVGLEHALHDQHVTVLSNGRFLRETRRFAVRNSVEENTVFCIRPELRSTKAYFGLSSPSKFKLIVAVPTPYLFFATARYSPLSPFSTVEISNLAM